MRHVLIVDDSQEILDLTKRIVEREGNFKLTSACSGYEGLLAATAAVPQIDLIILDLSLPDIDGLELLRQLSERSFSGGLILISGHSQSILQAARKLAEIHNFHVLGVLQKPFSPADLQQILRNSDKSEPQKDDDTGSTIGDLRGAKLLPHYQPQFNIETGEVVGFEALIRVALPDGPLLGPSILFSQLRSDTERQAIAITIAELVLKDVAAANAQTANFPKVSLNFDARVLEHNGTLTKFVALADRYEVPREQIIVEVIEKSLPKSAAGLLESLTRLRMTGFGLSLDDYGVGGSNHDLLRRCPFNELKLDRSLIQSGLDDPLSKKFITAAIEIASALEMRLVAEGVEHLDDLDFVRQLGIGIVQGFLFRKPMPIAEAIDYVSEPHLEELTG